MTQVTADLLIALAVWLLGFALFGRFISPRWKVLGKLVFFMLVAWVLAMLVGHWSMVWILGHPLLGIGGHVWWCKRNDINWLTCSPRDKYLGLRPWANGDGFGAAKAAGSSESLHTPSQQSADSHAKGYPDFES